MSDSSSIWYKVKTTANINENRMESPLATIVSQKNDDASRIYIIFKKEHDLHFKIFNCNSYYFEKSKIIDVTELGNNRVDFAIQKIVYINERLILIKQTYKLDEKALIMYEIKVNKAFPIRTKLIEDLLNNSIDAKGDGLIFFGGHDQNLVPHNRIFFYCFMTLKFEPAEPNPGPRPEPRFLAFSKLVNYQMIMTHGYASYANFYKKEYFKDVWSFDIRTLTWFQIKLSNNYPSSVSAICHKGDDIIFLSDDKCASLSDYNYSKREFTSIKINAAIEVEKGVN